MRRAVLNSSLLILATMAPLTSARAADGWYARIDLGYSVAGAAKIVSNQAIAGEPDLEKDLSASLALGYDLGTFRVEAEYARRENALDPILGVDQGGRVRLGAFMANVFADLGEGFVTPYVGAGLGLANVDVRAGNSSPLIPVAFDDSDSVMAYQAMAGVTFSLLPLLEIDVGYRYFVSTDVKATGSSPTIPTISFNSETGATHQAITVGLRLDF